MRSYFFAAAIPALVAAHGHVETVTADGKTSQGWNAALKYQSPIPATVGWQADNLDNGFIEPNNFGTADINCHKQSKSNGAFVTVKAGSTVKLQWDTWPVSHKGPVLDYLSPFAETPTALSWTKIAAKGWISGNNPGTWATDTLVSAGNAWTVTIPASLAPGNYVLRHEIIALHAAGSANGAQAYPQCINLSVTGSGSSKLSGGVAGTSLYKATDPGILFSLYTAFTSYTIPGPAVKALKKRDHAREFA